MARIGIITCSNVTQELGCVSSVCLSEMRERKGFFKDYHPDEKLDLVGIINCSGCPTIGAPQKILRRVRAIANLQVDTIHFSFCMTALCPFKKKYEEVIKEAYPEIKVVMGTHTPGDPKILQNDVKELFCADQLTLADLFKERLKNQSLTTE
ncbi:MAG TPA: CGGC domain-containing protein [Candidatus Margulisbacteria bacterium]|nr:CGGC domain-containing protein [Candidatus Margulisiibacteriota bacterium]